MKQNDYYYESFAECMDKIIYQDSMDVGGKPYSNLQFRYLNKLNSISDVVGRENVIVRPFERSQFVNSDIVADVLSITGHTDIGDLERPADENDRFYGPVIELKRLCNRRFNNFGRVFDRRKYIKVLYSINSMTIVDNPSLKKEGYMSDEKRREVLELYRQENETIAREYMGREDGILFKEPVKEYIVHDENVDPHLVVMFDFMIGMLSEGVFTESVSLSGLTKKAIKEITKKK